MFKNLKCENGNVTIEATISLTAFMFAIITILTVVNICVAQTVISNAINTTAKEISQYSYLYSLTGIPDSQKNLNESGQAQTENIDEIMENVNAVFTEIENLGQDTKVEPQDISGDVANWEELLGSADNIMNSSANTMELFDDIAKDPLSMIFGVSKLVASDGMDLLVSRVIAANLSKALCEKHLTNEKGGDIETYLKNLGIYSENNNYYDSIDFSSSTLFPAGSNEITVVAKYKIKLIPLLPLDFTFTFEQVASTYGWSAGDISFRTIEDIENSPFNEDGSAVWNQTSQTERNNIINSYITDELSAQGYSEVYGVDQLDLYNPDLNEIIKISSMDPFSGAGGPTSVDEIDETIIINSLKALASSMNASVDNLSEITINKPSQDSDYTTYGNNNVFKKVVIVIPEDEGLKEEIERIITEMGEQNVVFEVRSEFGNGTTTKK